MLPVAVDVMGGDHAPAEILAGARQAVTEHGVGVLLVGRPDAIGEADLPVLYASEVIGMDDDAGQGVRRKKDSSLVRAAEAVRDGRASAMVSAGNTGATMASALLRMGRIRGVIRPAIATPLPRLGRSPSVLLDSGANAECSPAMLVQFAQMGAAYSSARYGTEAPSVALLSIGEEKSKGTPTVKDTFGLLTQLSEAGKLNFVGNVEGRDLLEGPADVVVTDGFTGNVALKSLEGSLRFFLKVVMDTIDIDDSTRAAGDVLIPHLLPVASEFDPETTGGAMLLGVNGVCVISHGSSTARAIVNAIKVADDLARGGLVERLGASIAEESEGSQPA